MMHRPWSSIVEVPYCFSRSNVKFQGHTALKIVKFYRNWAFLDSNSSLNSLMVMKCCTKLETAKERCPIVFQSHPSNFKVTRDKTSPLLTRIGRFRTIGWSQLSNPSDLPCLFICQTWFIETANFFFSDPSLPLSWNQTEDHFCTARSTFMILRIAWYTVPVYIYDHSQTVVHWVSVWWVDCIKRHHGKFIAQAFDSFLFVTYVIHT